MVLRLCSTMKPERSQWHWCWEGHRCSTVALTPTPSLSAIRAHSHFLYSLQPLKVNSTKGLKRSLCHLGTLVCNKASVLLQFSQSKAILLKKYGIFSCYYSPCGIWKMTAEVNLVTSTIIKRTQFTKRQNTVKKQRKSSAWSDASYQEWWISIQNSYVGI